MRITLLCLPLYSTSANGLSRLPSPAIAAHGNGVYIVWSESSTESGDREISFRNSVDGGVTFGDTVNLSNSEGDSIQSTISVDRKNVYVAWADETLGGDDLFSILYRKSANGGLTFGGTLNLSQGAGSSIQPSIAASKNSVHIVWSAGEISAGEIFYRKSVNAGTTFGDIRNLSNNAGNSEAPAIAVSNTNVYVVWSDGSSGNKDILYITSEYYWA